MCSKETFEQLDACFDASTKDISRVKTCHAGYGLTNYHYMLARLTVGPSVHHFHGLLITRRRDDQRSQAFTCAKRTAYRVSHRGNARDLSLLVAVVYNIRRGLISHNDHANRGSHVIGCDMIIH